VLLWGDRHELRRALADARARLAGLEAQLADRVRTDARTGVLTLEAFRGDAGAVLEHAAVAEQPASLALVDIDGFRSLNARRGPAGGDAALRAVAVRL
jgi:GGDEF domain-containing protein